MAFHLGAPPERRRTPEHPRFGGSSVPKQFEFIEETVAERRSLQRFLRKPGGTQSASPLVSRAGLEAPGAMSLTKRFTQTHFYGNRIASNSRFPR
jgi:hypothetical protein